MIREEKVKEQFALAKDDTYEKKSLERTRAFFQTDYVGFELLVSFVTGTICFFILLLLWGLWNLDHLAEQINTMDYVALAITMVTYYAVFMLAYFFVTLVVYVLRYRKDAEIFKRYSGHLKKLNKIYAREEKLKL